MRVSFKTRCGLTPLVSIALFSLLSNAAESADEPSAVKQATKSSADVDAVDSFGKTALLNAISNRNPEMVRVLLRAGANTEIAHSYFGTPLIFAGSQHIDDLVWSPDFAAPQSLEVMKVLLRAGAGVGEPNAVGCLFEAMIKEVAKSITEQAEDAIMQAQRCMPKELARLVVDMIPPGKVTL